MCRLAFPWNLEITTSAESLSLRICCPSAHQRSQVDSPSRKSKGNRHQHPTSSIATSGAPSTMTCSIGRATWRSSAWASQPTPSSSLYTTLVTSRRPGIRDLTRRTILSPIPTMPHCESSGRMAPRTKPTTSIMMSRWLCCKDRTFNWSQTMSRSSWGRNYPQRRSQAIWSRLEYSSSGKIKYSF